MENLIINLTGFGLIIFIVWWFWLSKPSAQNHHDSLEAEN